MLRKSLSTDIQTLRWFCSIFFKPLSPLKPLLTDNMSDGKLEMSLVKRQRRKIRRAVLNECNHGDYSERLSGLSLYVSDFFCTLVHLLERPVRGLSLTDESPQILHIKSAKKPLISMEQL